MTLSDTERAEIGFKDANFQTKITFLQQMVKKNSFMIRVHMHEDTEQIIKISSITPQTALHQVPPSPKASLNMIDVALNKILH